MQIQPLYNAVIEPFFTLTVRRETFFFHGQRMILYCTVHRTNQGRQVRFRPTDSAATLLPQQLPHGGHLVLERLVLIRSVCIVVSKKKKRKRGKDGNKTREQGQGVPRTNLDPTRMSVWMRTMPCSCRMVCACPITWRTLSQGPSAGRQISQLLYSYIYMYVCIYG